MTPAVLFQDFETERLCVSHWGTLLRDPTRRAWLEACLADLLTPEVLKDLPPSMQLGTADHAIADWITERADESDVYLVRAGNRDDVLGLLVLVSFEGAGATHVHLGYLLAQNAWGRGYASELVQGLVVTAQNGPPCVLIGGVALDNPASARVLIKAGFARDAAQSLEDTDVFTLRIEHHA